MTENHGSRPKDNDNTFFKNTIKYYCEVYIAAIKIELRFSDSLLYETISHNAIYIASDTPAC